MNERAKAFVNKMYDCVAWGDLPWRSNFTGPLCDRLEGKLERMPADLIAVGLLPIDESYAAASVTKDFAGAAADLEAALDWSSSPEGEGFWESVHAVILEIEESISE